jgi:tRNA threonylcarbamoyladenosine modification (KEOPS) complex  Pcc1 subunit
MKITCEINLNYDTQQQAQHVYESVQVDDASFMNSIRTKKNIKTKIQTKTVPSMLHTADDFLSCVRIAEKITEQQSNKTR